MNISTMFNTISTDECLGYKPVSSSTKPAHIANGLFRRLVGKVYDPLLMNEVLVHWVRSRELNPSDALLEKESDPEAAPLLFGAKATLIDRLWPAGMVKGKLAPLRAN